MRSTARWSHLGAALIAVLATIVMTWPLAATAGTHVQDLGDPLLQIWTLKWDLHQLARDPLRLYDANTFTPFPQPLAYSESMLAIALLFAPLFWLTGNDVLAYNLVVLFTFAGSAFTAYLLARQFTSRTLAALVAGLAFAFLPYRFGHLSHLNLLSVQWLPLTLLCLLGLLRTGRPRWAVAFTIVFLLQALSSFYYFYLAAIACGVLVLIRPPWRDGQPARPRLLGLAAAGLVIGLVLTPISLPYFSVRQVMAFERTAEDVEEMAASPRSYLSVAPESRLYRRRLPERYPNPLFPGILVTGLAVVGLLTQRQRLTAALAAIGVVGLLLSFGLSLTVAGVEVPLPYRLLYDHVPAVRGLRDVARFGLLPLLALAVLAAAGLGWLCDRLAGPPPGRWRAGAAHGLAALAGLVVLAEFATGIVRATPENEVQRDDETLSAYRWLADQPRGLVMEFPADGVIGNVTRPTRTMYYSTYHWQPLVQGYSGFVPPQHYELVAHFPDDRRTATPSLLTTGNVGLLRDLGVRYLIFHRFQYSGGGWRLVQENLGRVEGVTLVGQFGPNWVYLLEPGGRLPVRAELLLPNQALADRPYQARYALQNPNSTRAVFGLGGKAALTVAWLATDGRLVSASRVTFQPGVFIDPGTRQLPLTLGLAPPPGDYHLVVTSDDPRLAAVLPTGPAPVTVLAGLG